MFRACSSFLTRSAPSHFLSLLPSLLVVVVVVAVFPCHSSLSGLHIWNYCIRLLLFFANRASVHVMWSAQCLVVASLCLFLFAWFCTCNDCTINWRSAGANTMAYGRAQIDSVAIWFVARVIEIANYRPDRYADADHQMLFHQFSLHNAVAVWVFSSLFV